MVTWHFFWQITSFRTTCHRTTIRRYSDRKFHTFS
jgi:hypothetical protein